MNRLLLLFMFVCLAPAAARAQCAMPSGPPAEAGVILFNDDHKVMQYCNGDKWIGLWGGRGGGGLPACANGEIAQFSGGAWQCNNGSGLTNLNASNLTSGTVPRARLGSGTANSTTFLRGDGTWAAPSGGGGTPCSPANVQTFNANGTWTKPSCGTMVKAECWGGGGSGDSGRSRGGGGGGYSVIYFPSSALPATVAVTHGVGGASVQGTSTYLVGMDGGDSSFGSYLTAHGGQGGAKAVSPLALGGAGGGGLTEKGGSGGYANGWSDGQIGDGEDTAIAGAGGGSGGSGMDGAGGVSAYGGNGGESPVSGVAVAGGVPGGGGGGAGYKGKSGAGGDGRCIVTTY